jgi:hypothetical protein
VSAGQLAENIQSIIGESDEPTLAGSRQWREDWWDTIVGYTVQGPYFWEGKGFGINLADADGFQSPDQLLRAPHNAHLNFLARGGVPGLALWAAIQVSFAITMIRAALTAAKAKESFWLALLAWIFVYWLAALTNMTFDVYLEGPQGGILFWSVLGVGLAAAWHVKEMVQIEDLNAAPVGQSQPIRNPPLGVRPRSYSFLLMALPAGNIDASKQLANASQPDARRVLGGVSKSYRGTRGC